MSWAGYADTQKLIICRDESCVSLTHARQFPLLPLSPCLECFRTAFEGKAEIITFGQEAARSRNT